MNKIQQFFEDAGYDLENDNGAAELCDRIVKHINDMVKTQPTFLDGKKYISFEDRLEQLRERLIKVYSEEEIKLMANS